MSSFIPISLAWQLRHDNFFLLKKERPLVNPVASGGQHPKDFHRLISGIIPGYDPFHYHHNDKDGC